MSSDLVLEGATERAITPLSLIQDALSKNVAPEVLKELVALQQSMVRFQWESEERQAKNDFDDALNSCQSEIGRIAPNQKRIDTGSFWADYSHLDRTIRPIYTAQKFSISFTEIAPLVPGKVRIQASLSRCGISKEFSTEITPSTTGPKGGVMATATDADAIAASRAKRYLLLDIFNVAIGIDEDENKGIPDEDKYLQAIRTADTVESLKKVFFNASKAAQGNKQSLNVLAEEKNKKYKELTRRG